MINCLSHVQLFATRWAVGFSVHGDSPGKNTVVGCHAFFQRGLLDPGIESASHISCIGRWVLSHYRHLGHPRELTSPMFFKDKCVLPG